MNIEPLLSAHAEATRQIYNHYVAHTNATPERVERSVVAHAQAISDFISACVARDGSGVVGFAFAKPYAKGLESFDPAVEFGVYLREGEGGRGTGSLLVKYVVNEMRTCGKHTGIAKIDAENVASIRLFQKCGFNEAARLHEIGEKNGKRVTVVYMQAMLQS